MTLTGSEDQEIRLLTIPSFSKTGLLALVDSETLDVEVVKIGSFEAAEGDSNGHV